MYGCLYLAIFSAVLGMLQFGYVSGVINAPQQVIEEFLVESFRTRYGVDIGDNKSTYFSFAVSILLVGGLVGALMGGSMADKFGRRKCLLLTQIPTLAGTFAAAISQSANSYELLLIGRLLQGLAAGLFSGCAPMYVAEVAPVHIRGAMGTVNQLAVTTGIFSGMVFGLSNVLGSKELWPVLIALSAIPSLIQCAFLPFMPESPTYLINAKEDEEGGRQSLQRLYGMEDVQSYVDFIRKEKSGDGDDQTMTIWMLLKDGSLRLPLVVCICLHLSQQLSGMVGIFYYSTDFFVSAGLQKSTSQYSTLGVGAIMVTMTIVTIPLMDRIGRRILHLSGDWCLCDYFFWLNLMNHAFLFCPAEEGLLGIIICSICITIALNYIVDEDGNNRTGVGVFLIVATMCFVVSFASGPGSIPWMAAGEMFTQNARGPATTICVFINWLANLAVGLIFPILQQAAQSYSFLPFLIIIILLFIILTIYFPETKGLSPDDINKIFLTPPVWRYPVGLKGRKTHTFQVPEPHSTTTYGSTGASWMVIQLKCTNFQISCIL